MATLLKEAEKKLRAYSDGFGVLARCAQPGDQLALIEHAQHGTPMNEVPGLEALRHEHEDQHHLNWLWKMFSQGFQRN